MLSNSGKKNSMICRHGRFLFLHFLFYIICLQSAIGQVHRVALDSATVLDDELTGIHILTPQPSHPVTLPPGDNINRRYVKEFYSWKMTEHPEIVVMVESNNSGDLLYIDKNLNADLTDDGPPILFPFKQDTITFDIIAPSDAKQRTKILFARTMNYKKILQERPDSIKSQEIDRYGNLSPSYTAFSGALYGASDFKGTAGTFYFGDRVSVRKGRFVLHGKTFVLGLYDYSNNGLFNDDDDLLITDNGDDGRLRNPYDEPGKSFTLNDVFTLRDKRYKIHRADKYGRWIEVTETNDEGTSLFRHHYDSLEISSARIIKFDPSLWDQKFISMEGDTVALSSYRDKYLLLNFWGEWCEPCRKELPQLVEARRTYPESLVAFLSFIKTGNKKEAIQVMKEIGVSWTQIPITTENAKIFNVRGYPSNILIFPNGKDCVSLNQVNTLFFKTYIK
jgi:thiol-disulfide isomerase/thioredoxin